MKSTIVTLGIACAIAAVWPAAAAVNTTELDARTDMADSGKYLLFVSKPVKEDAPMGDGFFAIGKGDSPDSVDVDSAYGMFLKEGRQPTVAVVSDERIATLMSSDSGADVQLTAVRIDAGQYEQIAELIDKWAQVESFDILPVNAALDATQEAISIVGFKRPYRSGLGMPNLMLYFADIPVINRKHTPPE